MTTSRKPRSASADDLVAQHKKTAAEFERWFSRLKRAMNKLVQLQKRLARLAKKMKDEQ